MKLGLKEIGAVVALATAGCTSPDLEDSKNETHPVCAVSDIPDAHSDTITEEMVKAVRTACATVNLLKQSQFISEFPYELRGNVIYSHFELVESAGEQAEGKCLKFHGLDDYDANKRPIYRMQPTATSDGLLQ